MAYEDFLVDKRVVERNIKKGLVDEAELKKQIEALPDREQNLVHVSLEGRVEESASDLGEGDDDLDDEDDDEEDESETPEG